MTRLYITRHGQTNWNLEGRMQGHKNSNLTELGKKQAGLLGGKLSDFDIDLIISSSSGRAIETANLIRGQRNIEMIQNKNLREISFGDWEGKTYTDIEKLWPEEKTNFWEFPHLYNPIGGESVFELFERVKNEIEKIISKHKDKNILIVTHGVTLKVILAYFEGKDIKDLWKGSFMNSTCLNIIEINEDSRNIILQGDISHLEGIL